jgi:hypothetical protein
MKLTIQLFLLVVVLSATQLSASTINFATDGFFYNTATNGPTDTIVHFTGSALKFTPQGPQTVESGSQIHLGTFTVTFCCDRGDNDVILDNTAFQLSIYVPGLVDGTPDATDTASVKGKVNLRADTITIDFNNLSFSANGANFVLDSKRWGLPAIGSVDGITGTGLIDVQATVTSAVPEPATMSLIGVGLLGAGMWRRRRPR